MIKSNLSAWSFWLYPDNLMGLILNTAIALEIIIDERKPGIILFLPLTCSNLSFAGLKLVFQCIVKEFWIFNIYRNEYATIKVQYECGNYQGASEYLYFHRILVQSTDVNYLNGMWGKLASEMLMQNWDSALEDFTRYTLF